MFHKLAIQLENRLPVTVRGVLWMVGAGFSFSLMTALIRPAAADLHAFQIVFLRNVVGLIIIAPWLLKGVDLNLWRSPVRNIYVLRAAMLLGAMLCWFSAVPRITLSEAIALNFSAPIFVTILAAVVLKEVIRVRRCVAIGIGFIGVLVIVQPGFQQLHFGQLLVLLDAFFWATAIILIRPLSRTQSSREIVAYMYILVLPFSVVPGLLVWTWPQPMTWLIIVGLALASTFGHYFATRAFAVAEASAVMPFDYLRLIWFSLAGFIFFNEVPSKATLLGAAIIAASSFYLVRREHQIAKARRQAGQ